MPDEALSFVTLHCTTMLVLCCVARVTTTVHKLKYVNQGFRPKLVYCSCPSELAYQADQYFEVPLTNRSMYTKQSDLDITTLSFACTLKKRDSIDSFRGDTFRLSMRTEHNIKRTLLFT